MGAMRFVVTGANGLLGSRLCSQLAERGHDVVALGRGPRRAEGPGAWVSVELTDRAAVERAIAEAAPQVILHPAAMTNVDGCERDPRGAWAANVEATANVARAAGDLSAHLVAVSTDYVFDGAAGPYAEDDVPNPLGVYARTKLAAEYAALTLAPGATVARTAVVYGWPMAANANFGAWLAMTLSEGREVQLFGDQWVSPSLADNVAAMLVELGERRLGGVWHTAGAQVVNRVTFGRRLCEIVGFDPSLVIESTLSAARLASPRPARSGLLVEKAMAMLEAKPLSLEAQLLQFLAQWRQRQAA